MLIVLEGVCGTGKTTIAQKLKEYFEQSGYAVSIIAHPSKNTFFGKSARFLIKIKNKIKFKAKPFVWLLDLLLVHIVIEDFKISLDLVRQNPKIVWICDRWFLSTLAYNCDSEFVKNIAINKIKALSTLPQVYWILFTKVEFKALLQRLRLRNRDVIDKTKEKLELIQENTAYCNRLKEAIALGLINLESLYIDSQWDKPVDIRVEGILEFLREIDTCFCGKIHIFSEKQISYADKLDF